MKRPLFAPLARIGFRLADYVRYSAITNRLAGLLCIVGSRVGTLAGDARRAERLLIAGARRLYPLTPGGAVERMLVSGAAPRKTAVEVTSRHAEISRGIILKAPQPGERGVILIAFENQWMRLFETGSWATVAEDYDVVLAPTWSPPYDLPMMAMARHWPHQFFTLVSNLDDLDVYARWSPRIVPIPLLASSWVNPELWKPEGVDKTHDIIVLANFSPYKRHFALFEALARMPVQPRVVLAGVPWEGHTAAGLRRVASCWGIRNRLEIRENLSNADLRATVEASRVAVFMARREGSCVAVAECLMQDIPVAMLADAHVGSRAFINDETGQLLQQGAKETARGLEDLLQRANSLAPRNWMLSHGHEYMHSSEVLNRALRDHALAASRPWTRDLVPHCHVRLAPTHVRAVDIATLRPLYQGFEQKYGIRLRLNAMDGLPAA